MSAEKKTWMQPPVGIGDVVLWLPDGDADLTPCAAIVTAKFPRSVDLAVIGPNQYNFLVRQGVRHCDDPEKNQEETMKEGLWAYTPDRKKLDMLLAQVMTKTVAQPPVIGKVG
jgi:hypothetical protein